NTVPFKSVIVTTYTSEDSNMTVNKKIESKLINYFNKKGLVLFKETIDENGKVSDSTRNIYDAKGNNIRELDYERSEKGKMKKTTDETLVYDAKGNILKDITVDIDPDDNTVNKTMEYNKYDTAGNVIESIKYNEDDDEGDKARDTTITTSKYDSKKRLIYSNTQNGNYSSKEYHTYNSVGMEIFNAYKSFGDSTNTIITYDFDGSIKEQNKYKNGKLCHSFSTKLDKDSNSIDTEEEISTDAGSACGDNTVTVTVHDHKTYMVLSQVTSRQKDGKPFTTTNLHRDTFNKNGLVTIDSSFITENGYLYSMTSIDFTKHGYDLKGRETSYESEGGGEYSTKLKWKRKYNDYPNGKSTKEEIGINSSVKTITYYAENSRIEKKQGFPMLTDRESLMR